MAERPLIGVTGNARRWSPSWWAIRLAVWLHGGQPYRINTRRPEITVPLAGMIIGGGDDIHPEHYGGVHTEGEDYDPERDSLEMRCIQQALDHNLPLLGICRGMQLINVVLGGSLLNDITDLRVHTSNRDTPFPVKWVTLADDSCVQRVTERPRLKVNSLHHQSVDRVGDGLQVVARDNDDIVQAIEHRHSQCRILGVQWHPEYLLYAASQRRLFRWLIQQSQC